MKHTKTLLALSLFAAMSLVACGEAPNVTQESNESTAQAPAAPEIKEEAVLQNQLKEAPAQSTPEVKSLDLGEQLTNTKARLMSLLDDNQCDTDSQCKVIGLGNRPCGGFESYEPISTQNKHFDEAHTIARELYDLSRQYNEKNQMMGICQHLPTPTAVCAVNKCELAENKEANAEY
jgi:hypothetical protein